MARPLRLAYPGALYHVTTRGNARQALYLDAHDRRTFLGVRADGGERSRWGCHAYCLMDNHYHLFLETPAGNRSAGRRQLNGVYTQRFNRCHGQGGPVFQGRFQALVVRTVTCWSGVARYGYSLTAIGQHLGLHYTTISKVVQRQHRKK